MERGRGQRKQKIRRLVGVLSVIAAVCGGIDLLINPTPLDVVVEMVLLANAGLHWKDVLGREA